MVWHIIKIVNKSRKILIAECKGITISKIGGFSFGADLVCASGDSSALILLGVCT